ncbi:choloylglycine hydrolase [Candidatus Saccharibacteria bacterium]|nr:choloylglycine hydrolase [Candidatus Saccharibacteria bacterium]MBQ1539944.1 choloylglycine hydrolase [Candidatus Saccharibacteria bacterium]
MCTGVRFSDDAGNMYFGRNLDWSTGYGQKVVVTPRGYKYKSAFLGTMSNSPALIGMGIVAENTPLYFDCANEHGLAVAGLNFPGYAAYEPTAVDGKTNVAAYEFPLWVALNFTSVDEVEKALKNVAIVSKPINAQYPVSQLHWIIGDAKRSIVVEYTKAGMEIFENDVDILTNQPGYGWHKENLRNYMNLDSTMPKEVDWGKAKMTAFGSGSLIRGLPGGFYSTDRFIRVAYFNTHYPVQSDEASNVSRLFHTLTGVAMIDGGAAMADGAFEKTVYTGGYSAKTKTYYYNTYENPAIKSVSLKDVDVDSAELIVL